MKKREKMKGQFRQTVYICIFLDNFIYWNSLQFCWNKIVQNWSKSQFDTIKIIIISTCFVHRCSLQSWNYRPYVFMSRLLIFLCWYSNRIILPPNRCFLSDALLLVEQWYWDSSVYNTRESGQSILLNIFYTSVTGGVKNFSNQKYPASSWAVVRIWH